METAALEDDARGVEDLLSLGITNRALLGAGFGGSAPNLEIIIALFTVIFIYRHETEPPGHTRLTFSVKRSTLSVKTSKASKMCAVVWSATLAYALMFTLNAQRTTLNVIYLYKVYGRIQAGVKQAAREVKGLARISFAF
jgi:hypothetical protein